MIVLTRVLMCAERASFVLRMGSLSALMVSLELAQSVYNFSIIAARSPIDGKLYRRIISRRFFSATPATNTRSLLGQTRFVLKVLALHQSRVDEALDQWHKWKGISLIDP